MSEAREFDVVLYGASGFTGGLVAAYLASQPGPLRWALAGRDAQKLQRVRDGLHTRDVPQIVTADASDDRALRAMVKRTRVVITTVGPYIRYGEPLLRAAAESGTHYVDLTGEPPFVALSRERYQLAAQSSGAKIVHCCGFDSVPHDLGAYFAVKALRARGVGSAPITVRGVVQANGRISGGTWQSALEIMGSMGQRPARSGGDDPQRPRQLPRRIEHNAELGLWLLPLPTIDPQVVVQSARLLPEYGARFRYGHYHGSKSLSQAAALAVGAGTVFGLAQLSTARKLLARLHASGEGPDEATREKGWFKVTFLAESGAKKVRCQVRGGDPGYGETSRMLAECALSLAFDDARLPVHYGVLTPAAAFGDVLIERLQRIGIRFEELA